MNEFGLKGFNSPDFIPMERVWWYMRKKITNSRYIDPLKKTE